MRISNRCGTLLYISPEFQNRSLISKGSDIYALGKMYYIMKTKDYRFNYRHNCLINDKERKIIEMTTRYEWDERICIDEMINYYNEELITI